MKKTKLLKDLDTAGILAEKGELSHCGGVHDSKDNP